MLFTETPLKAMLKFLLFFMTMEYLKKSFDFQFLINPIHKAEEPQEQILLQAQI